MRRNVCFDGARGGEASLTEDRQVTSLGLDVQESGVSIGLLLLTGCIIIIVVLLRLKEVPFFHYYKSLTTYR